MPKVQKRIIQVTGINFKKKNIANKRALESQSKPSSKHSQLLETTTSQSSSNDSITDKFELLEQAVVAVALDDCVDQLSIMKSIINENVNENWNKVFEYETLSERFNLDSPSKKQAFQEEVYEKIPFTDKIKLQRDICFLITTLKETAYEIRECGDFSTIRNILFAVRKQNEDMVNIEQEHKMKKQEMKRLKIEFEEEKRAYTVAINEAQQKIYDLRTEYEDVLAYTREELRYTNEWEEARQSQQSLKLKQEEDVYNNAISKFSIKTEYENRIHNEIKNFLMENIEDLQNSINDWMTRYDEEIEQRDSDIIKLKMKLEELIEQHRALAETYEERTKFVLERRAINEEKERQAKILYLQTKAAVKIQAWWRGTMVRKKLGPFGRKKKKGKGGKKDKGEKNDKGGKKNKK